VSVVTRYKHLILVGIGLAFAVNGPNAGQTRPASSETLPIAAWLEAGEITEIPWKLNLSPVALRMDQRLEFAYQVRLAAKDLNRIGKQHQLIFISRISTLDGEWLNEPGILRHVLNDELPKNVETQLTMRVGVKPGDYLLWLIVYDHVSRKHSLAKRRIRVPEIQDDPLPNSYDRLPLVEFPEARQADDPIGYPSKLALPVQNSQPLQIEIISTLSHPEQWRSGSRILRSHVPNIVGALTALSQLEVAHGSMSITGLDLVRRELAFQQESSRSLDWKSLLAAIEKATSPALNINALAGRKNNGAFFRDYLDQRITARNAPNGPKRVFIVLSESLLFANGADLKPLRLEEDCNCLFYHLRLRLTLQDTFDDLAKFMKPLHPRTFNLMTPRELRKAIAEIIEDLKAL
jgi:hypothetical protein